MKDTNRAKTTSVATIIKRNRTARRNRNQFGAEELETRRLLTAVVAPADPTIYATSITGPLAPKPGHTFYASGYDTSGNSLQQWANASAITPYTTNDLVLNVSPSSQTYTACCEAAGGSANVLTNGITQTQIGAAPNATSPAIGDGGAGDISNNTSVITGATGTNASFTYQLGTAGGATANALGYDLSEIDLISGHQDFNVRMYSLDVLVEPVGSTTFFSLSGGQGYSLTHAPDGKGGSFLIDKGSAQIALVGSAGGSPIASNVAAVKLVFPDMDTEYREFVVTGTASTSIPPTPPATASTPQIDTSAGLPVVQWVNPAPASPSYYNTVLRSSSLNGTYSAVGTTVGQQSFIDSSALPNSTYFYKVQLTSNTGTATSNPSAAATTLNFGATAYVFQNQLWQGTPKIIEDMPQVNYYGSGRSAAFPLAPGFTASSFSIYTTGKITTDLAGTYTFITVSDDDGYLYVNGQLVSGNPGTHNAQNPTITVPITLAAHTSYNFVLLHNQTGGAYSSNLQWQEPQSDGSAGPLTLVPTINLSPTPDTPPTPTQVTAQLASNNSIQVSWSDVSDQSSYAFVVQRAVSDQNGTPTSSFTTVGQPFSGPTATNIPTTWGAKSYVDSSGAANTTYVYRVGWIAPGQSTPATWAGSGPVTLPRGSIAALVNGVLQINVGSANDEVAVTFASSNVLSVTEGGGPKTGLPDSPNPIFTAPISSVNSVFVTGTSGGYSSLDITGAFNFSESFTAVQLTDIGVETPFSASQITLIATNNININSSISASGPITLEADSDANTSGILSAAPGTNINSGGNPISIHANTLALLGTVNSGIGSIDYSVESMSTSLSSIFTNTTSSGVVTLTQTVVTPVNLTVSTGAGISGTLSLYFPYTSLSTNGIATLAGNANLQIVATSSVSTGPINTGTGSLTLNNTYATLGGAVNAASVNIPVYAKVTLDGATMTVPGNIANAGSLVVGAGGVINCGGAITGGGSLTSGAPAVTGTVAYYRLEGTPNAAATGTGSIIDSSGNGFNATPVNGPVYSSSVPNGTVPQTGAPDTTSMSFNGSSQSVTIPDNPAFQITHSLTLEAYIYYTPFSGQNPQGDIIFRGDDLVGLDPYRLTEGTGGTINTVTFAIQNSGTGQGASVNAAITPNQWVHVAGVLDDVTGKMSIYVNGIVSSSIITSVRPSGVLTGPLPGLGIGSVQSQNYPLEHFPGMIDEVRISNVALTPSQFLDAPQRPSGATVTAGSIAQSAISVGANGAITLPHSAPAVVNTTNALNIAPGGKLDLANNSLLINYGAAVDPISNIRSYLALGFNSSAWNGTGIISSDAASNAQKSTAIGYADSVDGLVALPANTIELKYTLYGDTGLTGTVGFTDFMRMTQHFTTTTGATWAQGDFNYDGAVDASDFNLLKPNYGQTLPAAAVPSAPPPAVVPPVQTPIVVATPTSPSTGSNSSSTLPTASTPSGSTPSSGKEDSKKDDAKSKLAKKKAHKKK